jgi:hypothetical protein
MFKSVFFLDSATNKRKQERIMVMVWLKLVWILKTLSLSFVSVAYLKFLSKCFELMRIQCRVGTVIHHKQPIFPGRIKIEVPRSGPRCLGDATD